MISLAERVLFPIADNSFPNCGVTVGLLSVSYTHLAVLFADIDPFQRLGIVSPAFQFADCLKPVSYTHLDVYKRQG